MDLKCISTIFKIILFILIFYPSISGGTSFVFCFWVVKQNKQPRRKPQPHFEKRNRKQNQILFDHKLSNEGCFKTEP